MNAKQRTLLGQAHNKLMTATNTMTLARQKYDRALTEYLSASGELAGLVAMMLDTDPAEARNA